MASPIKADIVYYKSPSDFELEFNLGSSSPMRLLSAKTQNENEFLRSMRLAVSRSQIIIVIGSLKEDMALDRVCDAIGYQKEERDLSALGCEQTVLLPSGAIPLITSGGIFGGCVIECGPQSIIVLGDDKEMRKQLMHELVYEYISEFGSASKPKPAATARSIAITHSETEENESSPNMNDDFVLESSSDTPDFSELEEEFLQDEPARKKRVLPTIIWAVIFIIIGILAYIFLAEPLIVDKLYDDYAEVFLEEGDVSVALEELKSINEDVVGFIRIKGTDIALPVVSDQEEYYKNHLFNRHYNKVGTPYITGELLTDGAYAQNTVIYGNKEDGLSFSSLSLLSTLNGYRHAPVVTFDTTFARGEYKIFAVIETETPDSLIKTAFPDQNAFSEYTNSLISRSSVKTTVAVAPEDTIITLVADGKDGATLVFARRVHDGESPLVDTKGATEN